MARVAVKPGQNLKATTLRYGVYDIANHASIVSSGIPLASIVGDQYHRIDLGVQPLNGGAYIWFAGLNDPSVSNLYIDRIILIRDK
jgi:hypothetical protein